MKQPFLGKNLSELFAIVEALGLPSFTAKQLAHWLYKKRVKTLEEMTNLSLKVRELLAKEYTIGYSKPVEAVTSKDGTKKYLFQTQHGDYIESVYIPDKNRATLCVSSQVGCGMRCEFCMTGRQGFTKNLEVVDILNQIYALPEYDTLTNIVFMGQGEPFNNIDAVLKATQILTHESGFGWSPKRITISTVGIKKGLERFLKESKCHLAISLHNPFHEERLKIMPAEKAFPIKDVIEMLIQNDFCRKYKKEEKREKTFQQKLTFEYILFKGVNDSDRHVKKLLDLLKNLDCKINLIAFHSIPDSTLQGLSYEEMQVFCHKLTSKGLFATIRASRGEDIWAACGLLSTLKQQEEKNNN